MAGPSPEPARWKASWAPTADFRRCLTDDGGKVRARGGGDEKVFISPGLGRTWTKEFHLELQSVSSLPRWPWSGAVIQCGWLKWSPGSLELRSAVRPLWTHSKILGNQVTTEARMSTPVHRLALLFCSLICLHNSPHHTTPQTHPSTPHTPIPASTTSPDSKDQSYNTSQQNYNPGFLSGPGVQHPPCNARDTGSIPGTGRPMCRGAAKPMRHNYWTHALQLLKPTCLEPMLGHKRSHCNEKPVHHNKE